MHLHSLTQGMHCNITQATTVKDWVWVQRHTPPLGATAPPPLTTHINFFLIVCTWCGHLSNLAPPLITSWDIWKANSRILYCFSSRFFKTNVLFLYKLSLLHTSVSCFLYLAIASYVWPGVASYFYQASTEMPFEAYLVMSPYLNHAGPFFYLVCFWGFTSFS